MKALNSFALISLSSLAVAGFTQADEPIKAQPQQQQQSTIQAQTPQYQWVQTGRRQRWQLVNQNQPSILQSPASQQNPHSSAAQPPASTASSPARITPVVEQPVIETRRPGLLSRLRAKRANYTTVTSVTPTATSVTPSAVGQPLPNAK
jgi:hypothetical protein